MRTSFFLSLLSLWSATANAYADPMDCTGICNNAHDPALIRRDDGTYYRFSTNGNIAVHSAPSITGPWTYKGAAIPDGGSKFNLGSNIGLWAPDVTKVGDTYYLYYAASSFGSQNSAIGVATSKDLDSWTDHGSTGITSQPGKNYNSIDPALYWDGSKFVVTYGSFWGDIFSINMENPPVRTVDGAAATNVAFKPEGAHAQEGSYIAKNGDYHYLFFSVGQCCNFAAKRPTQGQEYSIQVCRSKSATGGFVDKDGQQCTEGGGTTVLESHDWVYAPGGQGVYYDPEHGPVLYYHYVDVRIGFDDSQKKLGINKIDFSSGWPVV